MGGFIYFRSGDTRPIDLDGARALGLGYAFGQVESRATNEKSPSGRPGLAFADPDLIKPKSTGVDLDGQTWRKMPTVDGRPELWVGYWNDAKPTPASLARPQLIAGDLVKLADGNFWKVPLVRRFDSGGPKYESALPCYWDLDDAGKPCRGPVLEIYQHLWDLTAPYAQKKFDIEAGGEEAQPIDDEMLLTTVAELLKANYVVDLPELVLMRALADDTATALVPLVAVDFMKLVAWVEETQKKSESQLTPPGSTSSVGEMAVA